MDQHRREPDSVNPISPPGGERILAMSPPQLTAPPPQLIVLFLPQLNDPTLLN